jgi:hypothetical protein
MPKTEQEHTRHVEKLLRAMVQRIEQGDTAALPRTAAEITAGCGDPTRALMLVLRVAGRKVAESTLVKKTLDEARSQMKSLLASPRRISKALGLVYDVDDEGQTRTWAIIEGPPRQACLFAQDVVPEEVCEQNPDEPIWVWLIEGAPQEYVVAGRIEAPLLLEASGGPETEMTFEGIEPAEYEQ